MAADDEMAAALPPIRPGPIDDWLAARDHWAAVLAQGVVDDMVADELR